jgi:hypothetical protein
MILMKFRSIFIKIITNIEIVCQFIILLIDILSTSPSMVSPSNLPNAAKEGTSSPNPLQTAEAYRPNWH